MALTFSSVKKPSPSQLKRLYQFAPWAKDRQIPQIRKMARHTPLFLSAWDGDELIGMARSTTDFTFRAVLWDVIVDPRYHRQGVGSKLVRLFVSHPSLKTVDSLWLFTADKQAFYKKLGFKLYPENMMVLKRRVRA